MSKHSLIISEKGQIFKADTKSNSKKLNIYSIELFSIEDYSNQATILVKYYLSYKNGDIRNGPVKIIKEALNGIITFEKPFTLNLHDVTTLSFSFDIIASISKGKKFGDTNPEIIINYELIEDEETKKSKTLPLENLNQITDQIHAENRTVYAVASYWGGKDRTVEFIQNSVWINSNRNNINNLKVDDILIMKSTFHRKGKSIFRIKAIGKVLKKHHDNSRLDVDWFYPTNNLDIEGRFRKQKHRILELSLVEYTKIFNHLNRKKLIKIFDAGKAQNIVNNSKKKPTFRNDGAKGQDLLDFQKDVRSFAALISYKEIKPPIAIAIFGKWGSGKSFFMNKLEEEIKLFPKTNNNIDDTLVKGIAHIKFNAWSYLDANLWAGLAHSLFEKLNEYITKNTKGDIERLKVTVKIAKRLDHFHNHKNNLIDKKKNLEKLKLQLERERESRILKIFSKDYDGIITDFLKKSGLGEDEINQLTPSKIRKKIETGINLFAYLKNNLFQFSAITITLTLTLLMFRGVIVSIWDWTNVLWTNYIAILLPFIYPIANFLKSKKKALAKTMTLIDELKTKSSGKDREAKLKSAYDEIETIKKLEKEVDQNITTEIAKRSNITQLAIANFVAAQTDSKAYEKHLGIITTIRKDFETLSELFSETQEIETKIEQDYLEELNKDRTDISKSFKEEKELKRIVLYIDDLDRCSDNKVIEVLEAVNLLMAFPLFVVVVGVDPRWVHNALLKKHQLQFSGILNGEQPETQIQKIGVSDYLEKIFQIPFHLKPASDEQAQNMIDNIFGTEIEEDNSEFEEEEMTEEEENEAEARADINDFKQTQIFEARQAKEFQKLTLSRHEFESLKQMIWLIDNSPRAIKRFTNIYRIIRGHERLSYDENDKNMDFLMVMFILGMVIGKHKDLSLDLLNKLIQFPDKSLSEIISDNLYTSISERLLANPETNQLLNFKGKDFSKHIPFIKRFSFENIAD